MSLSRRHFVQLAGAGFLLQSELPHFLSAQQAPSVTAPPSRPAPGSARVALIHGDDRRKNVRQALEAVDDQLKEGLRRKKYVVIKPNVVSTFNQLAATNVDALNGILDYLEPRFRGPVVIAESSAGDTLEGFEHYRYDRLPAERRSQKISLVDLNREAKYETHYLMDYDLHIVPVRLAARLFDPDAFVISSAVMKTHNSVVATLSVKNMVLGAPLHNPPSEPRWSDKRKMHAGVRQMNVNMLWTAQRLQPNWGAALIDGFEGMEGNGPGNGTPVASHIAIASTDPVAADRVGLEAMGINPDWVGYLTYCGQVGVGQYDLAKIDVVGASVASVQKKYELHQDIQRELQWMGPMNGLPPLIGSLRESQDSIYS